MTDWNMPPGCRTSDIPGNRPEDEAWQEAMEDAATKCDEELGFRLGEAGFPSNVEEAARELLLCSVRIWKGALRGPDVDVLVEKADTFRVAFESWVEVEAENEAERRAEYTGPDRTEECDV